MTILTINTTGVSTLALPAERATLTISISSTTSVQEESSQNVLSTSNTLQKSLKELSPHAHNGKAAPGSAITYWSMSTLATGSYFIYHQTEKAEDGSAKREMNYTATTTLTIKFADFKVLGGVCTDLSTLPFVSVRSVTWDLTDVTKASLVTRSRKLAVEDAVAKARDFASAVGVLSIRPVEINQDGMDVVGPRGGLFGNAAPVMRSRSAAPFGQSREESERLSFEPEEVEVSCSVGVRFEEQI
jgi:hypothetical protein